MPTAWWFRPVSRQARVGEHKGVTWKRLKRSPRAAIRSMPGVSMSEPKHPSCAKPRSSSTMMTTWGAFSGGLGTSGKTGVDSAMVLPIPTPRFIFPPKTSGRASPQLNQSIRGRRLSRHVEIAELRRGAGSCAPATSARRARGSAGVGSAIQGDARSSLRRGDAPSRPEHESDSERSRPRIWSGRGCVRPNTIFAGSALHRARSVGGRPVAP